MKKFEEIVKEVQELSKTISNQHFDDRSEEYDNLVIKRKILIHNAKIALFHEVVPVLLDILRKYNAKPMGEKTSQKIKDEFFCKTGYYFRFTQYGIQVLHIVRYDDNYKIEFGIKGGVPFLSNNRLCMTLGNEFKPITFEDVELWYMEDKYIEDADRRIYELKFLKERAIRLQRTLEKVCSDYNCMAPEDTENIYYNKYIY